VPPEVIAIAVAVALGGALADAEPGDDDQEELSDEEQAGSRRSWHAGPKGWRWS